MSKQSEAKEKQMYVAKAIPQTCGNCGHLLFDIELPAWMVEENKKFEGSEYTKDEHGVEKNLRCGVGGFAVKKSGTCAEFVGKP